jgi:hypothetical protein
MQIMKLDYEDGLLYEPTLPHTGELKTKAEINSSLVPSTRHQHLCGGWVGWHCEGSIIRSLFPLLMWEELYEVTIPNVFQTKYQEAPLDLYADHGLFYLNRYVPLPPTRSQGDTTCSLDYF